MLTSVRSRCKRSIVKTHQISLRDQCIESARKAEEYWYDFGTIKTEIQKCRGVK